MEIKQRLWETEREREREREIEEEYGERGRKRGKGNSRVIRLNDWFSISEVIMA